jgi:NAD(P)-dependent dehydrogenase (short-subunit alcohol dehydrogenase family)
MSQSEDRNAASVRRAALVTGASEGLGRATALALARDGCDVAVTDLKTDWLETTLTDVAALGRTAVPIGLDLRSERSIEQAFEEALRSFGRIDILVNNAGRPLKRPAVEVSWAEWDDVLAINLKGAFFLSARFARYCLEQRRPGSIVNMASTHGLTGIAERSVYGISKGGLIQMTRMLAIEWAAHGIRVNAVAPATVLTPSRAESLKDPATRQHMLERIPTGRFPTEEDVAAAVRYLASPEAASVTGHTLMVDGGLTAY